MYKKEIKIIYIKTTSYYIVSLKKSCYKKWLELLARSIIKHYKKWYKNIHKHMIFVALIMHDRGGMLFLMKKLVLNYASFESERGHL